LFNLAFGYCEVRINEKTQGIYLFTERPRDYALKTVGSPAIIRRGFDGKIDKMVYSNDHPSNPRRTYGRKFQRMYEHCRKYSGQALYDSLDVLIDVKQYMQWLAFNFLIRNGDYTDEIFLYPDPADDRFRIIPWDYDDIFSKQPHEGNLIRRKVPGGRFIYSSEDPLDRKIITDEYLYAIYLEQLLDMIEILNDSTLSGIIQDAYCGVYPYYLNGEIMETSRHDKFGYTNLPRLNSNLRNMLNQFLIIRNSVHQELNDGLDHSPLP
jgi:spore coat protein H